MFQNKLGRGLRWLTAGALALAGMTLSSAPANAVNGLEIRLTSPVLTDTNSRDAIGDASGWIQYYTPQLGYYQKYVKVGSTFSLTYTVTDNGNSGAAVADTTVSLYVNKGYSCSNAALTAGDVTVNSDSDCSGVDGAVLTGTTDADGKVTFTLTNTDTESTETDPATPSDAPAGTKLYSQIFPSVNGQGVDNADMLDIHFVNNVPVAHADARLLPAEKCVELSDDCEVVDAWNGAGWWPDPNGTNYVKYLPAADTSTYTWELKDEAGNLLPNVAVQLVFLAYGGENAKVSTDGGDTDVTPASGSQSTVDGVTDANGQVSFDITNTNDLTDAENWRSNPTPYTDPINGKELKANFHVVAVGATSGAYDGVWAHFTRPEPNASAKQIFADNWLIALDGSTKFYVPSSQKSVNVSAILNSDLAKIVVRGDKNLQTGQNFVYVDVTDYVDSIGGVVGDTKTYSFLVVKAAPVPTATVSTSKGIVRVHVSNAKGQTLTVRVNGKVFATKKITKSYQKVVIRVGSGKRTVSVHLTSSSTSSIVVK